jgi:1,4-dihydroxy-2-naphthoyl-CoA hydrolase
MSIWKSPKTPQEMNSLHEGTMVQHLGIDFTELGVDFVRATMPVDQRTRQPYGLLHGGASVVLAETIGSMGAGMCIDVRDYQCVGQEINANHVGAFGTGDRHGAARTSGRTQPCLGHRHRQ